VGVIILALADRATHRDQAVRSLRFCHSTYRNLKCLKMQLFFSPRGYGCRKQFLL
jgi:hypothetical protein